MKGQLEKLVRSLVFGALLGLAGGACGPSAAYRAGESAEQTGDWYTAVQAYRAALAEDPEDAETAGRLARAEENLLAQVLRRVDGAAAAADWPGALDALAPGLALLPNDLGLLARVETVRSGSLAHYESLRTSGAYRAAFEGAGRMRAAFPNDGAMNALLERTADSYAGELGERAESAERGGRPALSLGLWSVAAVVEASPERAEATASLRAELEPELAFQYAVRLDGWLRDWPAPVVAGGLAELTTDPDEAQVVVRALMAAPVFEESFTPRILAQDYISGYQQVPNPDYQACLNDIANQERRVLDDERAVLRGEEAAHYALVERDRHADATEYHYYYDRWDAAERDLQGEREGLLRQREELQRLRQNLTWVPPTVEQPVWSEYRYEVRDYTRTARAELTVEITGEDGRSRAGSERFVSTVGDSWHDTHPTLGLTEDPLYYARSEGDQVIELQTAGHSAVTGHVTNAFESYREGFETAGLALRATHPDDAAEELVRAALLDPNHLGEAARRYLDDTIGLVEVGWIRQ